MSLCRQQQKRLLQRKSRQPRGYATVMQDISTDSSTRSNSVRPVSNIYLEPSEIHSDTPPPQYEQVVNETASRTPKPCGQSEDTIPLVYFGDAASEENLCAAPTGASGVSPGQPSASTSRRQTASNDDEYVEMGSTDFSHINAVDAVSPAAEGGKNDDYVNSGCLAQAGCSGETKPDNKSKCTNLYASPMTISDYILENGDSILKKEHKTGKDNSEMHIYCNRLDGITDPVQRPLPPIPPADGGKS